MILFVGIIVSLILAGNEARIILPKVPSVVHPSVPTNSKLDSETVQQLQDSSQDPEVRPGLFQGDMALNDEIYNHWRVGLRWDVFPEKLWKNATVPYLISPLYEPSDYVTIYQAIRILGFMTCVKFVPWNGKAKDYLLIWPIKYPKGCWSYIGKIGGPQLLSLQPPDARGPNCLGNEGRAIHEIMHALGIFHEQSRSDRDRFVKIHKENIVPEYRSNFEKQSLENTTYTFEYDFDSIMHYGTDYFTKAKGKPTITTKIRGAKIGQRRSLSKTDCLKINDLYSCLENPKMATKYYALCRTLGL
ncbi:hatching enzyme 1.2 [Arctopsyche grandis]|uniref:hatching enzyme 1.2 n=1 Tax=Arctopsyche grandis TaxID=121162 RepID=UPI00406D7A18